jgi:hypothetical protein
MNAMICFDETYLFLHVGLILAMFSSHCTWIFVKILKVRRVLYGDWVFPPKCRWPETCQGIQWYFNEKCIFRHVGLILAIVSFYWTSISIQSSYFPCILPKCRGRGQAQESVLLVAPISKKRVIVCSSYEIAILRLDIACNMVKRKFLSLSPSPPPLLP